MRKLIIRNGRVIDPASRLDAIRDVLVEEGRIAEIGEKLHVTGAEKFDATGLIVAPGFIDMHVHLREPGFEYAETIESGSRAAAVACPPDCADIRYSRPVSRSVPDTAL